MSESSKIAFQKRLRILAYIKQCFIRGARNMKAQKVPFEDQKNKPEERSWYGLNVISFDYQRDQIVKKILCKLGLATKKFLEGQPILKFYRETTHHRSPIAYQIKWLVTNVATNFNDCV